MITYHQGKVDLDKEDKEEYHHVNMEAKERWEQESYPTLDLK